MDIENTGETPAIVDNPYIAVKFKENNHRNTAQQIGC